MKTNSSRSRKLTALEGNTQWLDGGAMFGNCPRALWERWTRVDDRHRIPLACRSLLIREEQGRTLLLEAGIGAFFEPKLRKRYGVQEERHVLLDSLAAHGLSHEQIDVVVLSHLHFDHVGGLLSAWRPDGESELLFPRARLLVSRRQWQRARSPHPRDRASYLPRLNSLIEASGRLELIDGETSPTLGEGYRFHFSDGHTPGMMLTEIDTPAGPLVFVADLIPGRAWTHLPISMGYDRYPELIIDEKRAFLEQMLARGGRFFFTHDPDCAFARLEQDDKGRYVATAEDPEEQGDG